MREDTAPVIRVRQPSVTPPTTITADALLALTQLLELMIDVAEGSLKSRA